MRTTIRLLPYDVDRRLRSIGLTRELLLLGVAALVTAHNGHTENDPPSAARWDGWRMGTRRLRELLRPQGWEKDDTGTFSLIVDHGRRQQIVVVNTDARTGIRARPPSNATRKGPFSAKAADENQHVLDIAGFREEQERLIHRRAGTYTTWCLCVFVDGEIVRAELSKPVSYSSGFITGWEERIVLIGEDAQIAGSDSIIIDDDGLSPDFPIVVQRK